MVEFGSKGPGQVGLASFKSTGCLLMERQLSGIYVPSWRCEWDLLLENATNMDKESFLSDHFFGLKIHSDSTDRYLL